MKVSELKSIVTPFKPITINLNSGFSVFIPHQDFLLFLPKEAGENVLAINQDGRFHLISTSEIASIDYYVIEKRT